MASCINDEFFKKLKEIPKPSEMRKHLIDNPVMSDVRFQFEDEDKDETGNSDLYAHKLLLSSAIPFFYHYFKQVHSNNLCVRMKGMRRSILKEIINYAYTDTITLNESNMFDILRTAKMMEIGSLIAKTTDFISQKISDKNIYKVLTLAQNSEFLKQRCLRYIAYRPDTCIYSSDDFPKISYDMLKYILQSKILAKSEGKIAVIRWVECEPETRTKYLNELLKCVLTNCDHNISAIETGVIEIVTRKPRSSNIPEKSNSIKSILRKSSASSTLMTFDLSGTFDRRSIKFANLNIIVKSKVHLKEIHFIYDLSSTDTEFEIKIINSVDNLQNDIFYGRVNIQDHLINGVFMKYVLPSSCILFGDNRKYRIKIQFPNYEFRPLWKNVKHLGEKSHIDLNSDLNESLFVNSQIIKSLGFNY